MQSNGKLLQLVFDVPLPAVDFIDNAPKHQRAYYQCFEPVGVYLGVSLDIADDPMDFIGQIFEALVGQTDDRRQTKITLFRKVEQFDPEQPGDLLSGVLSRAPKHAGRAAHPDVAGATGPHAAKPRRAVGSQQCPRGSVPPEQAAATTDSEDAVCTQSKYSGQL